MSEDLIRALNLNPETTELNVVISIDGEYYSIYPVIEGLDIPIENQILSAPKISGVTFDLRRVSTPIGTFSFELENSMAKKMLSNESNWLEKPCDLFMGSANLSGWTDYTLMASGTVVDITAKTNNFIFNCKEILSLIFKDFIKSSILSANIDAAVTTIPVEDTNQFQAAGVAVIDTEFIGYTGKTPTSLTGATRGIFGSVAKTHTKNTYTYSNYHFFRVNPINIMLQFMLSNNGDGANGPYDILENGLNISQDLIDVTSFEQIRNDNFSDAEWILEVYNIENILTLFEEEILQPLNCRLVTINGKITLTLLDNFTARPVFPYLDEFILVDTPSWKIESNKIINSVEVYFHFDYALGVFTSKNVYKDTNSINIWGEKNIHVFKFKGIQNDSGGNALIDRLIEKFLLRMSKSRGTIQCKSFYQAYNIALGSNVLLKHRYVPQVGRGMGVSTILETLAKSIDLGTGNVQFTLEFMSTAEFRTAVIGPTSLITSIISQTQFVVNKISLFEVGYTIELMGQDREYKPDDFRTITNITGNTVTINAPFNITTLVPDLFMKIARYDDATDIMRGNYGYISINDSTNITPVLISSNEPIGYEASASDSKNFKFDIVPRMSSNTAPAGYIASASNEYDQTNYQAWKVFSRINNISTDCWHTLNAATGWLKIKLPVAKIVNAYSLENRNSAAWTDGVLYAYAKRAPMDWIIQGSNNDSTWINLDTRINQTDWTIGQKRAFNFTTKNTTPYLYYRLNITANNGDPSYINLGKLYFYEIVNNISPIIPEMISNTAPAGFIASASKIVANYEAYKGFDGITNDSVWSTGDYTVPNWLKIELPVAKIATSFVYYPWQNRVEAAPTNANLEGSNDNTAWTILRNITGGAFGFFSFANSTAYKYYRLNVLTTPAAYGTSGGFQVFESGQADAWNAYDGTTTFWESDNSGLVYVDLVPTMSSDTVPAGWIAAADGIYTTYNPYLAFDNDNGNRWISGYTAYPHWIRIKLPVAKIATKYAITQNASNINSQLRAPTSWIFQGSNDASTWVDLHNVAGQTEWPLFQVTRREFLFTNFLPYLYYRLYISANNGGDIYQELYGLNIYEEIPTNALAPKWNALKIPEPISIKKYSIQNKNVAPVNSPKDWRVEGSNDGAAWEIIDIRSNQTDNNPGALREYTLSGPSKAFSNFRLYITGSNGGGITSIDEIKYYQISTADFADGGSPYVIIF